MTPEERDAAYLWDMLEYAKHCVTILANTAENDWHHDLAVRLAIERGLEIIGEAARQISAAFQDQHPEIPWRNIIGQRNILAHDYGQIDHHRLHKTVTQDIPPLIRQLKVLLPPLEEDP